MSKFKIGDVVYLKSGGPAMTVNRIIEERDNIECVWFVKNEQKAFIFNAETLNPQSDETSFIEISNESPWSSF